MPPRVSPRAGPSARVGGFPRVPQGWGYEEAPGGGLVTLNKERGVFTG